jgi:hypothetical protein
MVSACGRRLQVDFAHARGISFRRACSLLSVARSARRYVSRMQAKDAPALSCMRQLASQYPRFGYRRIQIFLKRAGHPMSCERTYRLWKLAGCKCRAEGRADALRVVGRDLWHQSMPGRCGLTTLCSTPARTVSS